MLLSLSKNYKNHIETVFNQAIVEKKYFKYIFVKNVLPESDYLKLTNNLKLIENFFFENKHLYRDDGTNDVVLDIINNIADYNSVFQPTFGEQLYKKYSSFIFQLRDLLTEITKHLVRIFKNEIVERDKILFSKRSIINFNELEVFGQYLKRKRTDFFINPHLHLASEIVDVLYYTPNDNCSKFNGTSLYYPRFKYEISPEVLKSYHNIDSKDFDCYHTFDYIPNSLVAWVNVPQSIHGSEYSNSVKNTINKSYIFFGAAYSSNIWKILKENFNNKKILI
jgi:hypothetical protein